MGDYTPRLRLGRNKKRIFMYGIRLGEEAGRIVWRVDCDTQQAVRRLARYLDGMQSG